MKFKKPAAQSENGVLTRRQMIQTLATVSVAASPLIHETVAADQITQNATEMMAEIFFESYATIALQRALRFAGDGVLLHRCPLCCAPG